MAGLDKNSPLPTRIVLHKQSRLLELEFNDQRVFRLAFELLRVYSPSAEVRGHGAGQEVLQTGKRDVDVVAIESVGHYALQPKFSDGHETGIFSWDYLYWLGANEAQLWADYEARIKAAGASRDSAPKPAQATDGAKNELARNGEVAMRSGGVPTAKPTATDAAASDEVPVRAVSISRPR